MHTLRTLLVAALLSLIAGCASAAQPDPVELVLERVARASDSTTGAVCLLDSGRTTVQLDGRLEFIGHEQILLLTWEAVDAYGQPEFSFSEDLTDFELLYARTILPSGEVVEIEDAGIRVSSHAEGGGEEAYSELKTVTLSMPSLRPGVVIDYAYVLNEEIPVIENEFFDYWYLEWDDPVQLSEYVLDVPRGMSFEWIVARRSLEPETQSSSDRLVLTFRAEDVEPIGYEIDMPSVLALESFVLASSIPSWEEVAAWWWDLVRDELDPSDELTSFARELTEEAMAVTDDERISVLYDFVAREVRYVALQLSASGYEPRPAADTFETRYGDCKDQVMLLIALLDSVGIEAHPVLISLDAGYAMDWSDPPSPTLFDHVLVAVPAAGGGWRFLDPTCSICTAGFADDAIRNRSALLVSEDPTALDPRVHTGTPLASESVVHCELTGTLDADDLLALRGETTTSGDFDIAYRSIFLNYRPTERRDLFAVFADLAVPQSLVADYAYSDLDDTHAPVTFRIDFEKDQAVRWLSSGPGLLPLPVAPAFPFPDYFAETILDFERAYPLLALVSRVELYGRIDIGDRGVAELPSPVSVANGIGSYRSDYSAENESIVYERVLQIDRAIIPPEAYPDYCELIGAMLEDAEAMAILEE